MEKNNIYILGTHKLARSYRDKILQAKKDGKLQFNDLSCIERPVDFIIDLVLNKKLHPNDVLVPDHTAKHVFLQVLMSLVNQKFYPLKAELAPFECKGGSRAALTLPPFLHKSDNDAIWALSYATWSCPPECTEPEVCPHIQNKRTWDFQNSLKEILKDNEDNSFVFSCEALFEEIACIPLIAIEKNLTEFSLYVRNGESFTAVTHSHCHAILGNFKIVNQADSPA